MNYILADNQELTSLATESLIYRCEKDATVLRALDKARLITLLREYENSVVVLNYTLFDFSDEEQLLILSERFPLTSWILLSSDLSPAFLRMMVYSSHQFSILFKDCLVSELREALARVAGHERYISHTAMEQIITQQQQSQVHSEILTLTEREIVKLIAQGKTTKEIAAERFSSIHTVTTHRKNIFRKLGVNTAHEATRYALKAGLIDASEFYI